MTRSNASTLLVAAAVVCFTVALLLSLAVIHDGNVQAWALGGLISFAAAHLP